MNKEMKNRDWMALGAIVFGALAFRLIFMSKMYAIGFDEVNYLKLAASANLHGLNHALHAYWSPFFPIVVALFSYIIRDVELAGRLVSILCSSLVLIPLFFFVKKHFSKRIAYGVSLLIACYSIFAYFGAKVESDSLYSFVGILGIICGWSAVNDRNRWLAFFTGILFGFAYLTRPEGIGFLIVFWAIIFLLIIIYIISRQKFLALIYVFLLSGIGFGLTSFPYLFFLHKATGAWTISTKGTVNQQGEMYVMQKDRYQENPFHVLNEDDSRLLQDEIYHLGTFVNTVQKENKPVVKISMISLVKKVFENLYLMFTEAFTKVMPVPLLLLFGLGLFAKPWFKDQALVHLYLLSYLVFFWLLIIPIFHITIRYFIPLLPISFVWIAMGADNFLEWFATSAKEMSNHLPRFLPVKVIGFLLVLSIILGGAILPEFGKRMKKNMDSTEDWAPCIEQKKAGLWLKTQGAKSPIIMAYNHAVSFYAGNYNIKESVEIPENTIDRILQYARKRQVDYLILNDRYRAKHPLIAHLFDQENVPQELRLIYNEKEKSGLRTLIYEMLPQ